MFKSVPTLSRSYVGYVSAASTSAMSSVYAISKQQRCRAMLRFFSSTSSRLVVSKVKKFRLTKKILKSLRPLYETQEFQPINFYEYPTFERGWGSVPQYQELVQANQLTPSPGFSTHTTSAEPHLKEANTLYNTQVEGSCISKAPAQRTVRLSPRLPLQGAGVAGRVLSDSKAHSVRTADHSTTSQATRSLVQLRTSHYNDSPTDETVSTPEGCAHLTERRRVCLSLTLPLLTVLLRRRRRRWLKGKLVFLQRRGYLGVTNRTYGAQQAEHVLCKEGSVERTGDNTQRLGNVSLASTTLKLKPRMTYDSVESRQHSHQLACSTDKWRLTRANLRKYIKLRPVFRRSSEETRLVQIQATLEGQSAQAVGSTLRYKRLAYYMLRNKQLLKKIYGGLRPQLKEKSYRRMHKLFFHKKKNRLYLLNYIWHGLLTKDPYGSLYHTQLLSTMRPRRSEFSLIPHRREGALRYCVLRSPSGHRLDPNPKGGKLVQASGSGEFKVDSQQRDERVGTFDNTQASAGVDPVASINPGSNSVQVGSLSQPNSASNMSNQIVAQPWAKIEACYVWKWPYLLSSVPAGRTFTKKVISSEIRQCVSHSENVSTKIGRAQPLDILGVVSQLVLWKSREARGAQTQEAVKLVDQVQTDASFGLHRGARFDVGSRVSALAQDQVGFVQVNLAHQKLPNFGFVDAREDRTSKAGDLGSPASAGLQASEDLLQGITGVADTGNHLFPQDDNPRFPKDGTQVPSIQRNPALVGQGLDHTSSVTPGSTHTTSAEPQLKEANTLYKVQSYNEGQYARYAHMLQLNQLRTKLGPRASGFSLREQAEHTLRATNQHAVGGAKWMNDAGRDLEDQAGLHPHAPSFGGVCGQTLTKDGACGFGKRYAGKPLFVNVEEACQVMQPKHIKNLIIRKSLFLVGKYKALLATYATDLTWKAKLGLGFALVTCQRGGYGGESRVVERRWGRASGNNPRAHQLIIDSRRTTIQDLGSTVVGCRGGNTPLTKGRGVTTNIRKTWKLIAKTPNTNVDRRSTTHPGYRMSNTQYKGGVQGTHTTDANTLDKVSTTRGAGGPSSNSRYGYGGRAQSSTIQEYVSEKNLGSITSCSRFGLDLLSGLSTARGTGLRLKQLQGLSSNYVVFFGNRTKEGHGPDWQRTAERYCANLQQTDQPQVGVSSTSTPGDSALWDRTSRDSSLMFHNVEVDQGNRRLPSPSSTMMVKRTPRSFTYTQSSIVNSRITVLRTSSIGNSMINTPARPGSGSIGGWVYTRQVRERFRFGLSCIAMRAATPNSKSVPGRNQRSGIRKRGAPHERLSASVALGGPSHPVGTSATDLNGVYEPHKGVRYGAVPRYGNPEIGSSVVLRNDASIQRLSETHASSQPTGAAYLNCKMRPNQKSFANVAESARKVRQFSTQPCLSTNTRAVGAPPVQLYGGVPLHILRRRSRNGKKQIRCIIQSASVSECMYVSRIGVARKQDISSSPSFRAQACVICSRSLVLAYSSSSNSQIASFNTSYVTGGRPVIQRICIFQVRLRRRSMCTREPTFSWLTTNALPLVGSRAPGQPQVSHRLPKGARLDVDQVRPYYGNKTSVPCFGVRKLQVLRKQCTRCHCYSDRAVCELKGTYVHDQPLCNGNRYGAPTRLYDGNLRSPTTRRYSQVKTMGIIPRICFFQVRLRRRSMCRLFVSRFYYLGEYGEFFVKRAPQFRQELTGYTAYLTSSKLEVYTAGYVRSPKEARGSQTYTHTYTKAPAGPRRGSAKRFFHSHSRTMESAAATHATFPRTPMDEGVRTPVRRLGLWSFRAGWHRVTIAGESAARTPKVYSRYTDNTLSSVNTLYTHRESQPSITTHPVYWMSNTRYSNTGVGTEARGYVQVHPRRGLRRTDVVQRARVVRSEAAAAALLLRGYPKLVVAGNGSIVTIEGFCYGYRQPMGRVYQCTSTRGFSSRTQRTRQHWDDFLQEYKFRASGRRRVYVPTAVPNWGKWGSLGFSFWQKEGGDVLWSAEKLITPGVNSRWILWRKVMTSVSTNGNSILSNDATGVSGGQVSPASSKLMRTQPSSDVAASVGSSSQLRSSSGVRNMRYSGRSPQLNKPSAVFSLKSQSLVFSRNKSERQFYVKTTTTLWVKKRYERLQRNLRYISRLAALGAPFVPRHQVHASQFVRNLLTDPATLQPFTLRNRCAPGVSWDDAGVLEDINDWSSEPSLGNIPCYLTSLRDLMLRQTFLPSVSGSLTFTSYGYVNVTKAALPSSVWPGSYSKAYTLPKTVEQPSASQLDVRHDHVRCSGCSTGSAFPSKIRECSLLDRIHRLGVHSVLRKPYRLYGPISRVGACTLVQITTSSSPRVVDTRSALRDSAVIPRHTGAQTAELNHARALRTQRYASLQRAGVSRASEGLQLTFAGDYRSTFAGFSGDLGGKQESRFSTPYTVAKSAISKYRKLRAPTTLRKSTLTSVHSAYLPSYYEVNYRTHQLVRLPTLFTNQPATVLQPQFHTQPRGDDQFPLSSTGRCFASHPSESLQVCSRSRPLLPSENVRPPQKLRALLPSENVRPLYSDAAHPQWDCNLSNVSVSRTAFGLARPSYAKPTREQVLQSNLRLGVLRPTNERPRLDLQVDAPSGSSYAPQGEDTISNRHVHLDTYAGIITSGLRAGGMRSRNLNYSKEGTVVDGDRRSPSLYRKKLHQLYWNNRFPAFLLYYLGRGHHLR